VVAVASLLLPREAVRVTLHQEVRA